MTGLIHQKFGRLCQKNASLPPQSAVVHGHKTWRPISVLVVILGQREDGELRSFDED